MRLDKYIASVTDLSRSQVKRALRAGDIHVNGLRVDDPALQLAENAEVVWQGQPLRQAQPRYFMLNKPLGYVCATKDREHSTVLELLDEDNLQQLHIAGRLDIDTTGLVLISDDGQWSHRVTSPRHQCDKTYRVETAEPIAATVARKFQEGVFLHQEKRRTLPAQLELLDPRTARLTICEGKYHQVKRMFAAVGNRVVSLHRERIGAVQLDPALVPGQYRALRTDEVAAL